MIHNLTSDRGERGALEPRVCPQGFESCIAVHTRLRPSRPVFSLLFARPRAHERQTEGELRPDGAIVDRERESVAGGFRGASSPGSRPVPVPAPCA